MGTHAYSTNYTTSLILGPKEKGLPKKLSSHQLLITLVSFFYFMIVSHIKHQPIRVLLTSVQLRFKQQVLVS